MAVAPTVAVKEGIEGLEFFGKVDINKHGNIGSEMPAWYFQQHKDELENNIRESEQALARGEIVEDKKPVVMADVRKMKEKLDAINESQVNLTPYEDAISKMTVSVGKKIKEAMPSRSDMKMGIVDAHEEARRMADPCIKLEGDEVIFAKKAGCKMTKDFQVSRDDAARMWKMGRRALGENSNIETLRRP